MSTLQILPSPPPGKSGWPWTEESKVLPERKPDGSPWPGISIITPSFNQGVYLEETIRSVLLQNYPNLGYLIIDGGSTDHSVEIIKKYQKWIAYWVSEPDRGQSHAINKGFMRADGEYVNWICSDDLLCKDALNSISGMLDNSTDILLQGKGYRVDEDGRRLDTIVPSVIENIDQLVDIKKYWRKNNSMMQQSVLYPLNAVRKVGLLNEKNNYSMDYELWGRLLLLGIRIKRTDNEIGIFRWYKGQKTSDVFGGTKSLVSSAIRLVWDNPRSSVLKKFRQIWRIMAYYAIFLYKSFRSCLGIRRRIRKLFNA